MISDDKAGRLMNCLPVDSYLRDFVFNGTYCTDAPMIYHVATGLASLAAVSPPHLILSMGQRTYGTAWFLLVGDSGSTKKTTAIDVMDQILEQVCPGRLGDNHGSVQSLYDAFSQSPHQIIRYGEAGTFLSQSAQAGSPLAPIREAYMGLWDCRSIPYTTVKKRRDVRDPRLNLVMGCAPAILDIHTTIVDWDNGFMGRWIILAGERERIWTIPPGIPGKKEKLVAQLKARFEANIGACAGITQEAFDYYDNWYREMANLTTSKLVRAWAKGPMARVHTVALKTALLFSMDSYAAIHSNGHDWQLGLPEVQLGARFAELHLESTLYVVEQIAGSVQARRRRAVLSAFQPGEPLTLGQLLARVQPEVDKRTLIGVLETMLEAQQLFQVGIAGGPALFTPDPLVAPAGTIAMWNWRQQQG